MENVSGFGNNSINPDRVNDKKAVFNNSTNGYINADWNYWGTSNPTSSYFGDAAYINDYINCSYTSHTQASGAGASKIASPEGLQLAMLYEENGDLSRANDAFRDVFLKESDAQTKRAALKAMLRIADKTQTGYDDLSRLVSDEQKRYSTRDNYRAIVDFIACDLLARAGKSTEAIAAFITAAPIYTDSPMEVEMYCRVADLYGKAGNTDKAREYADRAARINPGQIALMSAYSAAGVEYMPSEYANIFADWDGTYKQIESDDGEPATPNAPTVSISPNPANPATTIAYTLPTATNVKLSVYSVSGQKVAMLVDGFMSAGSHAAVFDGTSLASGVYFYRLETKGFVKTGKMVLVK